MAQAKREINRPKDALLHRVLPKHIWDAAEKQAKRSSIAHFSTGAVIFKGNEIISKGCSHPIENYSRHAEESALMRMPYHVTAGSEALVVTVFIPTGGWSYSSRPCGKCARILYKKGIEVVHYASRDENNIWSIRSESVSELAQASYECKNHVHNNQFGKRMYLSEIEPIQVVV